MKKIINKIINKIREYFRSKSAEQIFTLSLLIGCVGVMIFCAIVRLCGGLWFTADLESVPVPSEFWQTFILAVLFAFEMIFVYKILCRCSWMIAMLLSIAHTIITALIPTQIWTNSFNIAAIMIIPFIYTRQVATILDSIFLYAVELLYSVLFLVGRVGDLDVNATYNFTYNVVGTIDFKLFIVSIYLFTKYYGGFRLWKKQKRMLLQRELKSKGEI